MNTIAIANRLMDVINEHVNGSTFIAIDSMTDVKLKGGKSNILQNRVTKRVTGSNVMIFQNKSGSAYDSMVNRRLEKEGKDPDTFQLQPRKWGDRIDGTPFIEHKGQLYLEVIFLRSGAVEYLVDGVVTDPKTIEGLDLNKNEASQGGLDDKVILRTYKLSSLTSITINKIKYNIDLDSDRVLDQVA